MARKTKEEAARTRQRILDAALDVFYKKGYLATTIDDIATRIRLTKGAVYWHFDSKSDLILELVLLRVNRHLVLMQTSQAQLRSLIGLRDFFVQRALHIVNTPNDRMFFSMMMRMDWNVEQLKPVKHYLDTLDQNLISSLANCLVQLKDMGVVRPNIDEKLIANVLGGLWIGLIKASIDGCLQDDLEKTIQTGFDIILASCAH
jgi:AcrR family transcriptional regulator